MIAAIHGVVEAASRPLLTAGIAVVMAVVLLGVRLVCRPLKRRFDSGRVETAQGLAWTVTLLAGTGALVIVWRAAEDVRSAASAVDVGPQTGVILLVTGVVIAMAYTLTRVTREALLRVTEDHDAVSAYQRQITHHLVQISVYVAAVLIILSLWGVHLGDLLIGAGALGVIIGLAARQTLGAVLAGFVVLFARPFDVGDWVEIGDHEGVVRGVTIVNTRLRTLDDEVVLIPNDVVTATEIVNRSRRGRLRVTFEVGVDYATDLDRAVSIARETIAEYEGALDAPKPTVVRKRFGDSAVMLECRFHIGNPSAPTYWNARSNAIAAVHDAFADAGITIPFPQRTVSDRPEAPAALERGDGNSTGESS